MSKHFERRDLLKTAGISLTGLTAMSASVVASSNTTLDHRVRYGDSVVYPHDVTKVGHLESGDALMVVTLKEVDKRTKEVSYQDYGVGISEDDDNVEATQLSSQKANKIQQEKNDQVTILDDHWPEAPQVVKDVHHLDQRDIGGCAAFDHQHEKDGVSVKFTADIGKIGVGTAIAALVGYIGYVAVNGLMAAVGSASGYLSSDLFKGYVGTDVVSLAAHEYDVSEFGWDQTMWGTDIRGQWKQYDPNYMFTVFTTAGHPTCGNCGF